jgi:hypothetical protein
MEEETNIEEPNKNKPEYQMLPLKSETKERLFKMKQMNESWDETMNRILDKVASNDERI